MPAARAASSREDPSSTRARASIRRAARASRHRPASRRSSAAPSSSRVIATVMAPSADRPHRRSTASGATRLRARQHVRNSARWYYASRHGRALIDRALYLPEGWAGDPARRAGAGVPAAVAFTTKPKLGAAMLERALDAGVPCSWVTGDGVYGADRTPRRRIEARGGLGGACPRAGGAGPGGAGGDQRPAAGRPARGRVGRRGAARGLAAAERRRGQQGAAALRLGVPALPRRPARLGDGAAGPAQARRAGRA